MHFKTLLEKTSLTHYRIDELKFNEKSLEKVVKLYSSIMGKDLGGKFRPLGLEEFNRKTGPGKGFRLMNNVGEQLRFNWDQRLAQESKFELTSIDYWKKDNFDFQKPNRTVSFAPDLNVVQVLSQITDALKSGSINEAESFIKIANTFLFEAPSTAAKQEWLQSNGLPKSLAGSEKAMVARAEKDGLGEKLKVFLGQKETNSFEEHLISDEALLDKTVYADPETVFEDIEDLLSLIATGKWKTLVVCGAGGIGKTYHITDGGRSLKALLGPEGDKWVYNSGTKAAPFSFYKTLFQSRDKIIVWDEADSLLKNPDIIMMLKPILDTSGDNMAAYMSGTYNVVGMSANEIEAYSQSCDMEIADGKMIGTGKNDVNLPSKFKFTGGMVFISNMKASQIEQAIMSRSIFVDVYLAEQDVLKRIKTIGYAKAKASEGSISVDDIDQVFEALGGDTTADNKVTYMTAEYARKSKQVTVRSMSLALIMKQAGLSNWARLAAIYA